MQPANVKRRFKRHFDRHYTFLRDIAKEGECGEDFYKLRRIITYASDDQLNILLDCIHFVLNGQVGLCPVHYQQILNSPKRVHLQDKLESQDDLYTLRKGFRKDKVDLLLYLGKVLFPIIQSYFDCDNTDGTLDIATDEKSVKEKNNDDFKQDCQDDALVTKDVSSHSKTGGRESPDRLYQVASGQ